MSPLGLANYHNSGRWSLPEHLLKLDRAVMDVEAGRIDRLLVEFPPRHGKSEEISHYLPAHYLGIYPDRRVILTSYEADFAAEWGSKAKDVMMDVGPEVFGVKVRSDKGSGRRWGLVAHSGIMYTAGVGGPITGKGANLLIIDDPVKNAEEAHSKTYRDKTWDWYQTTAKTRLEPKGAIILIMTRWHQDDLGGRIKEREPGWTELKLPALAERDDPLGRVEGEALWSERYPADVLRRIKKEQGSYFFSALYQQRPTPPEGGIFHRDWFQIIEVRPAAVGARRCRFWDMAGTENDGDYTVGTLVCGTLAGGWVIEDVLRGQWSAGQAETIIKQTASVDGRDVTIEMEQEPGSSGKTVIANYVKMLAGYDFHGKPASGPKELRWNPLAAQAEAGNVAVVRGEWNREWLNEMGNVPNCDHDDQADSAAGAFNRLALGPRPARNLRILGF